MAKLGRPTDNPADIQLRIRLTKDDHEKLKECAERLNKNKSDVVRKGIDLVYQGLEKE